jgi:hypothetical protein
MEVGMDDTWDDSAEFEAYRTIFIIACLSIVVGAATGSIRVYGFEGMLNWPLAAAIIVWVFLASILSALAPIWFLPISAGKTGMKRVAAVLLRLFSALVVMPLSYALIVSESMVWTLNADLFGQ